MLKGLIPKSDIIEVDGKIALCWTLHQDNGFECTTHTQTDASVEHFYKITDEDLDKAIVEGDYWIVSYTQNKELRKAKIQLFTKHLLQS